jgi:hypothetical protein
VNGGNLWTSTDFGVTWIENPGFYPPENQSWISISISSTGQYQTACVEKEYIWISKDYGLNWNAITAPGTLNWKSVSISSTGQCQTACVNGGNLWTSRDYGLNWNAITAPGKLNWQAVSISSTGQYQSAITSANIWISKDFGITWSEIIGAGAPAPTTTPIAISMSSTGHYQTICASYGQTGQLWMSSDYGTTWSLDASASSFWTSISIAGNGLRQTACVIGGNIWTSQNPDVVIPGNMSIGKNTITAGVSLDVNGNIRCTALTQTSDYRIKDNVHVITNTIDELRPLSYFNRLSGKEDMGFIAHELQEHFPFLVNGEKDGKDYQSVNYTGLIGLLVKEVQDLKQEVHHLKSRVTILETPK